MNIITFGNLEGELAKSSKNAIQHAVAWTLLCNTHHRANPMAHDASSSYNATSNHILFFEKTKTQLRLHNSNKCMSCCHSCIETQHRTETCLAQIKTRYHCVALWRAVIQRANEFVSCLFCDVALNKIVFAYCCATVRKKWRKYQCITYYSKKKKFCTRFW